MRVLDSHCHLGKNSLFDKPSAFLEDFKKLNRKYNARFIPSIATPSNFQDLKEKTQELIRIVAENKIFAGICFWAVDKYWKESQTLLQGIPVGMIKMIKIMNPWEKQKLKDSKGNQKIIELAIEHRIPVYVHVYYDKEREIFEKLARQHYDCTFILGHLGNANPVEEDKMKYVMKIMDENKNVFIETSGLSYVNTLEPLARLFSERILFGSDFPGRYFSAQLIAIQESTIDEVTKRKILNDNATKLFLIT
ncbi:MAG: amidohydrolase family protein [Candidatus Pacearchaeota archaeon]